MKIKIKILLILVVIITIFCVYMGIKWLGSDLCNNEDFVSLHSISQKHEAVLYIRSCGATTDYNTNIEIDKKKIFTVEGYYKENITMKWDGDNKFIIEYSGKPEDIFSIKKSYKDINIELIQK